MANVAKMSIMSELYKIYRILQNKYNLKMIYRANQYESKIIIYQIVGKERKEFIKIVEEDKDVCFIRAKQELEKHKL